MRFVKLFEQFNEQFFDYSEYIVEDNENQIIKTNDYQEALRRFNNYTPDYSEISPYDKPTIILSKKTYKYKFIKELEGDENIEDYDFDSYRDDEDYYELINESDWEELDSNSYDSQNDIENKIDSKIDDILYSSINKFQNKFTEYIHKLNRGGYRGQTHYYYLLINEDGLVKKQETPLFKFDEESYDYDHFIEHSGEIEKRTSIRRIIDNTNKENIVLQVRFANHSQDINNINEIVDCSLSVVVCNENDSYNKFTHDDGWHEEIIFCNDESDSYLGGEKFFYDLYENSDENNYIDEILNHVSKWVHNECNYYQRILTNRKETD